MILLYLQAAKGGRVFQRKEGMSGKRGRRVWKQDGQGKDEHDGVKMNKTE